MANETDILARWEQLESDVLNPVMAAAPPPFGESTRRQLLPTLGKTSLLKQPTRHYLNQGGTGMVMEPIRNLQYLVAQLAEEQPMAYHRDIAPALMRRARESAAAYLGTSPKNLSFMASASSGFYAVMRAITFRPGDIVLTTSLRYHSFDDDLRYVCETKHSGLVEVRTVQLPLPINSSDEIVAAFKAAFDAAAVDGSLARIRLAFFDHVSSKPSVLFPVKELCTLCREHGVPSLVDGAHAPGLLCWAGDACASSAATSALRLDQLDPDYYIANFYSPHTAATVAAGVETEAIYAGVYDESTRDYAPFLTIPGAMQLRRWLNPAKLRAYTEGLAQWGSALLARRWGTAQPVAGHLATSMITAELPLPMLLIAAAANASAPSTGTSALLSWAKSEVHRILLNSYQIECPVFVHEGVLYIRASCAFYNCRADIEALSKAVLGIRAAWESEGRSKWTRDGSCKL